MNNTSPYKICVVTGTRAEYWLLRNVIRRIHEHAEMDLCLIATGAHLAEAQGMTVNDIKADGFPIAVCIDLLAQDDTDLGMAKAVGQGIVSFADFYATAKPDVVLLLGDRYELFAAASAAAMLEIPLAHIHGGETTQGAIDEYFRHCITKMSALHFVAAPEYAARVMRMGEQPGTVFNVGGTGVESIRTTKLLDRTELSAELGFSLEKPYALVTFHPETLADTTAAVQIKEVLAALEAWLTEGKSLIITKANADAEGQVINEALADFSRNNPAVLFCASLGATRYLSAMKHCEMVVGNSSSGIAETPSLHVPTINIGDRQKGRLMADSVICCPTKAESIIEAMRLASSAEWRARLADVVNPYGSGETSKEIVEILAQRLKQGKLSVKKAFFDGQ
jgi:GDP/UDP-N,N'-diacetylbacillosamine 2-epimerase (hydrolysing)